MSKSSEPKFIDITKYYLVFSFSLLMDGDGLLDMDTLTMLRDQLDELSYFGELSIDSLRAMRAVREEESKKAAENKP